MEILGLLRLKDWQCILHEIAHSSCRSWERVLALAEKRFLSNYAAE
jgi:hypothetical protein